MKIKYEDLGYVGNKKMFKVVYDDGFYFIIGINFGKGVFYSDVIIHEINGIKSNTWEYHIDKCHSKELNLQCPEHRFYIYASGSETNETELMETFINHNNR